MSIDEAILIIDAAILVALLFEIYLFVLEIRLLKSHGNNG
jgi:hypothetical protein